MNNYNQIVKLFYKRIAIIFLIYQICRLLFWIYNKDAFSGISPTVFVGGMIYDLAAIGMINLIDDEELTNSYEVWTKSSSMMKDIIRFAYGFDYTLFNEDIYKRILYNKIFS